jgi:hypothetical protein
MVVVKDGKFAGLMKFYGRRVDEGMMGNYFESWEVYVAYAGVSKNR